VPGRQLAFPDAVEPTLDEVAKIVARSWFALGAVTEVDAASVKWSLLSLACINVSAWPLKEERRLVA
jgi:hypothetical protein